MTIICLCFKFECVCRCQCCPRSVCLLYSVWHFCVLVPGVLEETASDPFTELQWTSADQSSTQRREGLCPQTLGPSLALPPLSFDQHQSLFWTCTFLWFLLQVDSDGSDSPESSEEAELRRKKIEAVKVRFGTPPPVWPQLYDRNTQTTQFLFCCVHWVL